MAIPGQRFELDLESEDFAFNPLHQESQSDVAIKEIREHETSDIPPPPAIKPSKGGFPTHKARYNVSAFKPRQERLDVRDARQAVTPPYQPSDRAIRQQVGKKYGVDFETQQKAEISQENKRRLAEMTEEDIEEARAELLGGLSPEMLERMMKRANIDEAVPEKKVLSVPRATSPASNEQEDEDESISNEPEVETPPPQPADCTLLEGSSVHFPVPPRSAESYTPLDPNSETFLDDLRSTYFPELHHNPSSLSWLQDSTPEDDKHSSYNPTLDSYPASSIRFDFSGRLIPPKESLNIPVSAGLHHHGDAPNSAGYTVPELTLLARSAMPNQRCVAYQTAGRIMYRLGKEEFGKRTSELEEAIWDTIEHERILELMMAEANKQSGHISAKAYATEALWLWRKGGGSDRGLLRSGQTRAK